MILYNKIRNFVLRRLKKIRDFILRSIINYMPLTVQLRLFKSSSRLATNPDFTWYLGKIYEKKGYSRAIAAYEKAIKMSDFIKGSTVSPRRQAYQFSLERARRNAGLSYVDDPLFLCGIESLPESKDPEIVTEPPGSFKVIFKYNGALFKVKLKNNGLKYVELLIDGVPFRRIKIIRDTYHYKFTVKRPSLSHFPTRGKLSVRTSDGTYLVSGDSASLILRIPHGSGDIEQVLRNCKYLGKKGGIPDTPEEIFLKQNEYLKLYERAKKYFDTELSLPLFLMYGTLLGLYRDGDFIPGDDDFDVGYISQEKDPIAVKKETKTIIANLVRAGFTVSFNQAGRPFRLSYQIDGHTSGIHLDIRPVWYQDGHIWAHKQACLLCSLDDFQPCQKAILRGTEVYIPNNPEAFLKAYYGPGWKIPDPSYTNDYFVDPKVIRNLSKVCWTVDDYRQVRQSIRNSVDELEGDLIFKSDLDLYPLENYEAKCGWS